jgi:hypothetical protein
VSRGERSPLWFSSAGFSSAVVFFRGNSGD